MKFLCPQCKAKYRIADEKLATRASSRMKCRKCGHVIDIQSATVPDSMRPPGHSPADADAGDDDDDAPPAELPRAVSKSGVTAPRRPAPQPTGGKRPTTSAAPVAKRGAPPRRTGAAAVAVSDKTMIPDAEDFPAETTRLAPQASAAVLRKNEYEEDQPTRIHDGAALSSAFSMNAAPSAAAIPATTDDWYVGIDGTPTGPLSIASMREHAGQGKVGLDSLVWRDGFEEWKSLRDFPELVALVDDAAKAALAATEALKAAPRVAPVEEPPKKATPVRTDSVSEELAGTGVKPRRTTSHPMAWVAVIVALAFGVTIGAVLLSKEKTKEVVKYVEVPASASAAPPPVAGDTVLEESQVAGGGTTTKRTGTQAPKTDTSTPPPVANNGILKGLPGMGLPEGPKLGGPDTPGPGPSTTSQLDGNAIQRTVAQYSTGVRRGCWDSALAARAPDAPSSARVGVTITIGASGNVDDVKTGGDPKGYPGLSRCIEAKVRGWHFPRSGGTTTANVPFVFAAQ